MAIAIMLPITILMANPASDASAVFNIAAHNSGQSRIRDSITWDGAGIRNDCTHPRRTASSVVSVTTTAGTIGGSTLRMKERALMRISPRRAPELRTRLAFVVQTARRYGLQRCAARAGRACGRG